jgi:hypothetical protein
MKNNNNGKNIEMEKSDYTDQSLIQNSDIFILKFVRKIEKLGFILLTIC